MKSRGRIIEIAEALLAAVGLALIPLLPRCGAVALARWLGSTAFRFSRRERRIALANVDLAFGPSRSADEKLAIVRESFQVMTQVMVDLFWFRLRTAERLRRHVSFDPLYQAHYVAHAPCIVVTAHFGNWEVMGLAVALDGHPLHSVAMPLKNRYVDAMLSRARKLTGQEVVPRRGAVKALLRILRHGGRTAFLMDQNTLPDEGGQFVDFFGRAVPVSGAAEMLSLRTGAPVLCAYCDMDDVGNYLWRSFPPVFPGTDGPGITQRTTGMLEELLRQRPGLWLWMYKRWKFIPPGGDPSRYPYYARQLSGTT
jgi:KDO2-lipid IV(A) lauroyltransferase